MNEWQGNDGEKEHAARNTATEIVIECKRDKQTNEQTRKKIQKWKHFICNVYFIGSVQKTRELHSREHTHSTE